MLIYSTYYMQNGMLQFRGGDYFIYPFQIKVITEESS
jgi:hypothetical protein